MLKISMQTLSFKESVASGEYDLLELIGIAADLGYDGVDLEDRQFESTRPDYLEKVRAHAGNLNLPISYIGVQGGFGETIHGDDDGHASHIKTWIDVASVMRVPTLRLIGCRPEPGESDDAAWSRTVVRFREAVNYASPRGVQIGLHNHNHGMFPATSDQIHRMMDEIDHTSLVHILDTGQFRGSPGASGFAKDSAASAYDVYENILGSIDRASLVRTKIYAIGSGRETWLDYDRILGIIGNSKYVSESGTDRWLSVVFEGRDGTSSMDAMTLAIAHLRELLEKHQL
jgi:hypothetical protein